MKFTLFAAMFATLTFASPSLATVVCATTWVDHTDEADDGYALSNLKTEDYWTEPAFQALRGAEITVRHNTSSGAILFSGELDWSGSTPGCTSSFSPSGAFGFWVQVRSEGHSNNNYIEARDDDAPFWPSSLTLTTTLTATCSTCTANFTPTAGKARRVWMAYAATAHALFRSAGGVSGQTFYVDVYSGDKYGDNRSFYADPEVKLRDNDRKFVTVHEVGHRLAHLAIGGYAVTQSCSANYTSCEPPDGHSHSMGSKENMGCAFQEGFAHFYAALAWNSVGQDDCVFNYYKNEGAGLTAVDCELNFSSPGSYPVAFMENQCSGVFDDKGVEVDWLRAFWDVKTNGTSEPSFIAMADWMHDAFVLGVGNSFEELDYEANIVGGVINTNWDAASSANGIDH